MIFPLLKKLIFFWRINERNSLNSSKIMMCLRIQVQAFLIFFNKWGVNKSIIYISPKVLISSVKRQRRLYRSTPNYIVSGDWDLPLSEGLIFSDKSFNHCVYSNGLQKRELDALSDLVNVAFETEKKVDIFLSQCNLLSPHKHNIKVYFEKVTPTFQKEIYVKCVQWAKENRVFKSHDSSCPLHQKIEKNIKVFKTLLSSMKKKGYVQQGYKDMVYASIDRNGNFILENGRHRAFSSAALGIEKIPVAIGVRHYQWVSKKWKFFSLLLNNREIRSKKWSLHPDLIDFENHPLVHFFYKVKKIFS